MDGVLRPEIPISIALCTVGVGPETGNLDNLAAAGATGQYYPVFSGQEVIDALFPVVHRLAACIFNLDKPPQDPSNVALAFNGDMGPRAPQDATHMNGWDYYTTPAKISIRVYGSWCDNLANGTYSSVELQMGCPGMTSP